MPMNENKRYAEEIIPFFHAKDIRLLCRSYDIGATEAVDILRNIKLHNILGATLLISSILHDVEYRDKPIDEVLHNVKEAIEAENLEILSGSGGEKDLKKYLAHKYQNAQKQKYPSIPQVLHDIAAYGKSTATSSKQMTNDMAKAQLQKTEFKCKKFYHEYINLHQKHIQETYDVKLWIPTKHDNSHIEIIGELEKLQPAKLALENLCDTIDKMQNQQTFAEEQTTFGTEDQENIPQFTNNPNYQIQPAAISALNDSRGCEIRMGVRLEPNTSFIFHGAGAGLPPVIQNVGRQRAIMGEKRHELETLPISDPTPVEVTIEKDSEFKKWAVEFIKDLNKSLGKNVDPEMFFGFIGSLENPVDIEDYFVSYFGETNTVLSCSKQFLQKRIEGHPKQKKYADDDLSSASGAFSPNRVSTLPDNSKVGGDPNRIIDERSDTAPPVMLKRSPRGRTILQLRNARDNCQVLVQHDGQLKAECADLKQIKKQFDDFYFTNTRKNDEIWCYVETYEENMLIVVNFVPLGTPEFDYQLNVASDDERINEQIAQWIERKLARGGFI
uniref:Uncharacterized protein n=1 Tax=Panagrolaimus sp. ES5 TaxID=591445 RepID=A0AC34GUY9_9BILA